MTNTNSKDAKQEIGQMETYQLKQPTIGFSKGTEFVRYSNGLVRVKNGGKGIQIAPDHIIDNLEDTSWFRKVKNS